MVDWREPWLVYVWWRVVYVCLHLCHPLTLQLRSMPSRRWPKVRRRVLELCGYLCVELLSVSNQVPHAVSDTHNFTHTIGDAHHLGHCVGDTHHLKLCISYPSSICDPLPHTHHLCVVLGSAARLLHRLCQWQ